MGFLKLLRGRAGGGRAGVGRGVFTGSLGPSWQSAPLKPGQHLHSSCVTILNLVTYLGLKFTRYLRQKRVAALFTGCCHKHSVPAELDSDEEGPGHSVPRPLSPGLLNPAVTPGVRPKSFGLLPPPLRFHSTPPAPSSPPTEGGETDNTEKLGPAVPAGCGHFSQTDLLFHQQTSVPEFAALWTIFQCNSGSFVLF